LFGEVRGILDDEAAMNLALEEARKAEGENEVPVGAVVVVDGEVVARDHNRREQHQDPSAHAELLAMRSAAKELGSWRLTRATLYVSLEPCPMCAGAAVAARLERLVFGAFDPKAGACGSLYNLCSDPRLNHEVELVSGVSAAESGEILKRYFLNKR
jgi:tRNA(adenine34) deaminase